MQGLYFFFNLIFKEAVTAIEIKLPGTKNEVDNKTIVLYKRLIPTARLITYG